MSWVEDVVTALSGLEGRVFVGLSGGADSAVLAHCAVEARLEPTLVYVHHGLPGSDAMESAANAVAERLESPLAVLRTEMDGSSETEARATVPSLLLASEWDAAAWSHAVRPS